MASPERANRGGPGIEGTSDAIATPGELIRRTLRPSAGDPFAGDDAALHQPGCLRAQGRGKYQPARVEGSTLLVSLRGTLEIHSVDGVFRLRRRHFLCLPNTSLSSIIAASHSDWMALRLPHEYAKRLSASQRMPRVSAPWLLPTPQPLSRPLMRCISELLKSEPHADGQEADARMAALLLAAMDAQSDSAEWVRRAYGRSERHRRAVVVRLLSARNRIVNAPFLPHDLNSLAAAARYSPSHFLRSFRDVFGKTPRELLTGSRLAMACDLIRGSDLAISEIASSVGYESRHAFSRLFKRETGSTASDFRCGSALSGRD